MSNITLRILLKLFVHYMSLIICYGFGAFYAISLNSKLFNPELLNTYDTTTIPYILLTITKTFWLFPFCYLFVNTLGHLFYPPLKELNPPPSTYQSLEHNLLRSRIIFRYVTRGLNRTLIVTNVSKLYKTIEDANFLPDHKWFIEVVTDKELNIRLRYPYQRKCTEIVVPKTYTTPNKTMYKGRALHYALQASNATPSDWIVHLDEESEPTSLAIKTYSEIYC